MQVGRFLLSCTFDHRQFILHDSLNLVFNLVYRTALIAGNAFWNFGINASFNAKRSFSRAMDSFMRFLATSLVMTFEDAYLAG